MANEKQPLSNGARDKVRAAALWANANWKEVLIYQRAPAYFDACLEWHAPLSDAEWSQMCSPYRKDG